MKNFVVTIVIGLVCTYARSQGISFQQDRSWESIQQLARQQQKLIFVDCYATWCGPCKEMDRSVYPVDSVGSYMNEHFISVKVQMDSTKGDGPMTREWYPVVHQFLTQYKIGGFPTFLFFSPDGRIVHRGVAYQKAQDFLKMASDARSPNTQMYTLLGKYDSGERDYTTMVGLAVAVGNVMGDRKKSEEIAGDYYKNHLMALPVDSLLTIDNILFITSWWPKLMSSNDVYFHFIYTHLHEVDSVMKEPGFALKATDAVISREEIWDPMHANSSSSVPDWKKMYRNIEKTYGKTVADRNIVSAEASWYYYKKDWEKAIRFNVEKIDRYGMDTTTLWGALGINDMAYELIFKHCNDTIILLKAAKWMEAVLRVQNYNSNAIDTYANLLYKAGRKPEALEWQERAVKDNTDAETLSHLDLMKQNKPTWPNN